MPSADSTHVVILRGMKTAVSVPDDLFAQVDRLARKSNRSRSEIYSAALREYLARHQPDEVTASLDRVVAEVGPSADRAFIQAAATRALAEADW
jgi:Ribbon-helix-helix protein, copG family